MAYPPFFGTEVIAIGILAVRTFEKCTTVDSERVGEIHKAATAHLVIADLSEGGTNFQEREIGEQPMHEFLIAEHPSDGACGESTEAFARGEVLRSVVAEVDLGKIFVVVCVCDAADESHISTGNVGISLGIVVLALIVEGKAVILFSPKSRFQLSPASKYQLRHLPRSEAFSA